MTNNEMEQSDCYCGKRLHMVQAIGGAAVIISILGVFVAPTRLWPSYLVAFVWLAGLGLAGLFFTAVHYVTKAGWGVVIRRVPEAMTASLGPAALMAIPLLFGAHTLYEWSHSEVVATDAILGGKAVWLNMPFFFTRTAVYFALWIGFAFLIVRNSRRQDADGDPARTAANVRLSAIFLVVFAVTVTLAGFDWLMSLEPHWYSTIFGAYVFAGLFQGGIAVMTIIVILLRQAGAYRRARFPEAAGAHGEDLVSDHHYHDLGKLLFAFSSFWAYLWFCQYMLIWYANIPEETVYFVKRRGEGWSAFFFMNLVLNWVIPFLAIMARTSKRNERRLFLVAIAVAVGRWMDLYVMIVPVFAPAPVLGLWEIAPMAGVVALFALVTRRALAGASLVPLRDPYLAESLKHHQ